MDNASDTMSAGPEDPSLRRACDQCRTRKIRCDRTSPCSNCRVAMRACSSIGITHKPKEQRNRVLISQQYERKIDLIEERLSGIEGAIRSLAANGASVEANNNNNNNNNNNTNGRMRHVPMSSAMAPTAASSAGGNYNDPNSHTDPQEGEESDSDGNSAWEGDLSLTAHTAFASDFLESAVQRTSLSDPDLSPNMHNALASLRHLVHMQNQSSSSTREFKFRSQQPLPPGGLADMPMPPMNVVVSMLKQQKTSPPSLIALACAFLDIDDVAELCRKVYFNTDSFSHSCFVIVCGCLYYLFMEQSFLAKDPTAKAELAEYQHMCQVNLETALATLPLMLPAKMESIEALLVGSLYSIDVSKSSLAWHFASTAATLCQTLGYHRATKNSDEGRHRDSRDNKTLLFWHTYCLDKSLALRTGRSSAFQDWDITLPRRIDSSIVEDPWGPTLTIWIKDADIQHQIYQFLYSPTALNKSREERMETARRLAAEQKSNMAEASQIREQALFGLKAVNASTLLELYMRGDELAFHSTLTLIYRAMPPPDGSHSRFTVECIETARLAMHLHHECMQALQDEGQQMKVVYVHWAILLTPFAPFFVLFCYVIETLSNEDLKRLSDFVKSLSHGAKFSDSVEKLHRLTQALFDVAKAYVEAKSQTGAGPLDCSGSMQEIEQMLGPVIGVSDTGAQGDSAHLDQLGDWFLANNQIMGWLETDSDMSNFGQGGFM